MSSLVKKFLLTATVAIVAAGVVVPGGAAQAQTVEELQAQIEALLQQVAALQAQLAALQGSQAPTGGPAACAGVSFTRNLTVGDTGDDVKCLQALLNQDPATQVAQSGPGSPGNETTYFGPLTRAAVVKFQEKYASEILAPLGLSAGTGFVGPATRAKLGTMVGGQPSPPPGPQQPPTTGVFSVALAPDTPSASTVVAGQALADLAKFLFSNSTGSEIKVTSLKLKRLGVSADTTLSNVYLFDGAARLTDAASVSAGTINFNNSAGVFSVAPGTSKTITVKSDIAAGTSGQTLGVGIEAASDVVSNAASVLGAFPINGNLHTVATATTATVDFNATTTPSTTSIAPQNDYPVWQNTVTIGTRAVYLHRFAVRQIGSVKPTDLQNFRLLIDGVQVGSSVQNLGADGYVTFDLTGSPKRLETGSRTFKVLADVVGGSNLNFIFSHRNAADSTFTDSQFGTAILPTANSATFSARETGTVTIDKGVVTVEKAADSPSGDIVKDASSVVLAKYIVKAAGEPVKIESLKVTVDSSDNNVGKLRNGALFANGVQVGSTADLNETDSSSGSTTYNLGSSLIVQPGSPVTLEVRADIYDNDGTNNISSSDTLKVTLKTGSSNGFNQVSSTTINVPTADVAANQLTVKTGGLTLSKLTAYVDKTFVPPVTAAKLAHFTLNANTTEAVNLNTITLDLDDVSDAFDASDDLTNLYVTYGNQTTSVKATVSDTGNSWSINYQLAAGATIDIQVFANVAASATDGDTTDDKVRSYLKVEGTTVGSATSVTGGPLVGQTITFGSGSISSAVDGSSPLPKIVSGSTAAQIAAGTPKSVTAAAFKFTAISDTFTIKEVKVKVDSASVSAALINAVLKDGSTVLQKRPFDQDTNTAALFTGLSVAVPANSNKVLTVDLELSEPKSNVDTSGVNAKVTLDSFKYADSQGVEATDTTDRAGNDLYVYASIPTVTLVDLPNTTLLANGSEFEAYKFTVSADSAKDIALKQLKFNLSWSDGGTADTLELKSFKFFRGSDDITSLVTIQDNTGVNIEGTIGSASESSTAVYVTWDSSNEETIPAGTSRTYTLKAVPQGFGVNGASDTAADSVSIQLVGDASHNGTSVYLNAGSPAVGTIVKLYTSAAAGNASATAANFIWSDTSSVSHVDGAVGTSSTDDWWNGYKVLNLDLGTEAWRNK